MSGNSHIPYYQDEWATLYNSHVLDLLPELPAESVQCVVTSPPYWALRDYGLEPQVWDEHGIVCTDCLGSGYEGGKGRDQCPSCKGEGRYRCEHEWGDRVPAAKESHTNVGFAEYSQKYYRGGGHKATEQAQNRPNNSGQFCHRCGAWRGSLGLEPTPELYIKHIVDIFREVRRVLRKDGTMFLNLGDSYAAGTRDYNSYRRDKAHVCVPRTAIPPGLKPKDLVGVPWRVAFALQADGWYLRSDIIWNKPNPMPESVKDRPTKSHEYLFLLTKSAKYFYDQEAIKEKGSPDTHARYARGRSDHHKWADGGPGNQMIAKSFEHMRKPAGWYNTENYHGQWPGKPIPGVNPKCAEPGSGIRQNTSFSAAVKDIIEYRNKRTVWTIPTQPFPKAHFATFPEELVQICLLAGTKPGDIVLDPFAGRGTVLVVAKRMARKAVGIELNLHYCELPLRELAAGRFAWEAKQ